VLSFVPSDAMQSANTDTALLGALSVTAGPLSGSSILLANNSQQTV
jgi:hypothetical protein